VRIGPQFACELPDGTDLAARLSASGFDPARVDRLALSHLHFDHVGGSHLVPGAEVLVQRAEWRAVEADVEHREYLSPPELGERLRLIDGELDVYGDGRVRLVPTTGHTAGHQSLFLRTDEGRDLVLTSDACYLARALAARTPPPSAFDRAAQLAVYDELARLAAGGARLIFGHDPEQWPTGSAGDAVVELAG
jgi:glyoxylase-like metal-dependent hydrolase (beta-lactamase superfamily II)